MFKHFTFQFTLFCSSLRKNTALVIANRCDIKLFPEDIITEIITCLDQLRLSSPGTNGAASEQTLILKLWQREFCFVKDDPETDVVKMEKEKEGTQHDTVIFCSWCDVFLRRQSRV